MKKAWLLLPAMLLLKGCGDSVDPHTVEQWEITAQHNAIEYTRQKYGFSAHVTGAAADYDQGMFGYTSRPEVFVSMEHEGRAFTVYIRGDSETAEGRDSYQAPEICDAAVSAMQAELPEVQKVMLSVYDVTHSRENTDTLFDEYYDGGSITEFLRGKLNGMTVLCNDTDLTGDDARFAFVSDFFNENQSFAAKLYALRSDFTGEFKPWENYIPLECSAERTVKCWGNPGISQQYTAYVKGDALADGTFCVLAVQENGIYSTGAAIEASLTETEVPDLAQFVGNGIGKEAVAVTGGYRFRSNSAGKQNFYIPISAIRGYSQAANDCNQYTFCAVTRQADGTEHLYNHHFWNADDYLVCKVDQSDWEEITFFVAYSP